jgi:hypothetical protein
MPYTLGELARRMDRLETTMAAGFDRLAGRLEHDYVQLGVYASERSSLEGRVAALEAAEAARRGQSWQLRLSLAAALMSVPTSVIAAWLVSSLAR